MKNIDELADFEILTGLMKESDCFYALDHIAILPLPQSPCWLKILSTVAKNA